MKVAMVTGTGMDSFYLSSLLLSKGYKVICVKRRSSSDNAARFIYLRDHPGLIIASGDVTDLASLEGLITRYQPDEFYSLAAMSFVADSFKLPIATAQITGLGVLNCLEALRIHKSNTKFYHSSSSEMLGDQIVQEGISFLNENSFLKSRSPYSTAKIFGHLSTINYREAYNMFAVNGTLFNHGAVNRGEEFVERKITKFIAQLRHKLVDRISFGNLNSRRDFGASPDYVRAMFLMLQQESPKDYVIGTGKTYSPREILHIAADHAGISNIDKYVHIDPELYRPTEVNILLADATCAQKELKWTPSIAFDKLICSMVDHDMVWYNPNLSEFEKLKKCRPMMGDALCGKEY